MKQSDFINTLIQIHDLPNLYNNKFPKNLGYYDGKNYSYDCWNLIKIVLSGYKPTPIKGYYFPTSKLIMGDVDGKTLLNMCHSRSKDFSKIRQPGTYLYIESSPHSGIYVGDFEYFGKIYNVIECTKNKPFNADGVTYTYVDDRGRRLRYKGGVQSLSWSEYGLFPATWLEYDKEPTPLPDNKVYTLDDFRADVRKILGVQTNIEAFNRTITISTIWNKHNNLVTPLEKYFKALGYYNGEVEQQNGKKADFGGGMKEATRRYQKYVVGSSERNCDGVLTKRAQTWRKLLLG